MLIPVVAINISSFLHVVIQIDDHLLHDHCTSRLQQGVEALVLVADVQRPAVQAQQVATLCVLALQ
jgi:hypothetical protein